jgi:hypothetical protein
MECHYFTIIIANKKILNVHKLEYDLICHLFIIIIAYIYIYILQNWNLIYVWSPWKWTSFMYNHHCKEKTFLMYIN